VKASSFAAHACLLAAVLSTGCRGASATPTSPSAAVCAYVPDSAITVNAVGGAASAAVQTRASCRWTATADAWIATSPGMFTGPGALPIAVAPNRSFDGRTGKVVIRSESGETLATHTVTERGAGCLFTVSPGEHTFTAYETYDGSGDNPFEVRVHAEPADCRWTASSSVSWLGWYTSFRLPPEGTGDGRFSIVSDWNMGAAPRTGEIVVSGLSGVNPDARLVVTQTGR